MTFKIVKQLCQDKNLKKTESRQNKFIERSALSKHNTRHMNDLNVPKQKLEHTKNSFCTLVQKPPGIVSHSSSETPNPLYDSKRSEMSPCELIENSFARIH